MVQPLPSVTERVNVYVPQVEPANTETDEPFVGVVMEPFPVIDQRYEVIEAGPL